MQTIEEHKDEFWNELNKFPMISDYVTQQQIRFNEFFGLDELKIVIFGSYNSGKSSLIKRLLVDMNSKVPDWLTISGGRETFQTNQVSVNGLQFIDTPGLASEEDKHDLITLDALKLADAYLWIVPLNFITSKKEQFYKIFCEGEGIAEATIVAISRMDKGEIDDPSESVEQYNKLCEQKKIEFNTLLQSFPCKPKCRKIHCISADPYGEVRNTPQPEPTEYDEGRSWDGLENLLTDINDLKNHKTELRNKACVRFMDNVLTNCEEILQKSVNKIEPEIESIDEKIESLIDSQNFLNDHKVIAKNNLKNSIEDLLIRNSNLTKNAKYVRGIANSIIPLKEEWEEECFVKLIESTKNLDYKVHQTKLECDLAGFEIIATEAEEVNESANSKFSIKDLLNIFAKSSPKARESISKFVSSKIGMTPEEAMKKINKLDSKTQKLVNFSHKLEIFGPVTESLVIELTEKLLEKNSTNPDSINQEKIDSSVRIECETVVDELANDYFEICDAFGKWNSEQLDKMKEDNQKLTNKKGSIHNAIQTIENLRNSNQQFFQ